MNVSVQTYIKVNEKFVRFDLFGGEISDPNYIDGAIVLTIDGTELFGYELWDYVIDLWHYIINGLEDVAKGKSHKCSFPDQPISIGFDPLPGGKVRIERGKTRRDPTPATVVVDLRRFAGELEPHVRAILNRHSEICPDFRIGNDAALQRLACVSNSSV